MFNTARHNSMHLAAQIYRLLAADSLFGAVASPVTRMTPPAFLSTATAAAAAELGLPPDPAVTGLLLLLPGSAAALFRCCTLRLALMPTLAGAAAESVAAAAELGCFLAAVVAAATLPAPVQALTCKCIRDTSYML
jgi:hypothetical protein